MYHLFIDGWGDITYFESSDLLLALDPITAGIVAFLVQLFFAWRLHIIAAQPVLTIFIVALSLLTVAGAVGTGIVVYLTKEFIYFQRPLVRQITCIWLISTAVADICICGALTFHLRRRRGSYDATDRLLDRIIRRECFLLSWTVCACTNYLPVTVQNGLLTSLLAVGCLVAYLASVRTSFDLTIWLIQLISSFSHYRYKSVTQTPHTLMH